MVSMAVYVGAQGVYSCDVRTKEEAETIVEAGRHAERYFYPIDEDFVLIGVQIESVEAMKNLDDILSVKGLDFVSTGGADYRISAGITYKEWLQHSRRGQVDRSRSVHPLLEEYDYKVMSKAREKGLLMFNPHRPREEWPKLIEEGLCQMFLVVTDRNAFSKACKENLESLRNLKENACKRK